MPFFEVYDQQNNKRDKQEYRLDEVCGNDFFRHMLACRGVYETDSYPGIGGTSVAAARHEAAHPAYRVTEKYPQRYAGNDIR